MGSGFSRSWPRPALCDSADRPVRAKNGEWRSFGGEEASTRYSPLDQINCDNVKDLKVAWTWKSDNFGAAEFKNESTPIIVNGIL